MVNFNMNTTTSKNGMCHGVIHLHGHLHLPEHLRLGDEMVMDVGVEGNGWAPIEMMEVLEIMKNQDPCKPFRMPKTW